ncbi:recombinase family protein [Kitasatospora cineracea]|uniref:recombinase family protein n=1 Tax=Kitasatospora cineracea TaxID=88074 RepID=UPI00368E9818
MFFHHLAAGADGGEAEPMPPRLFGFANYARSELNDAEAAIAAEAAQLSVDGASDAAVAAFLAQAGFAGTLGAAFTSQSARQMLANPAIAGLKRDETGKLVPAGHPAAITPELFMKVQEKHEPKARAEDYDYMLTSVDLTVCGRCGTPLVGQRTSAGKPGYCCPDGPRQDRPGECGRVRIDAGLLEDYIGEQVLARLLLPGTQADLEKARELIGAQVKADRLRLAEIEESVQELAAMVIRRQLQAKDLRTAKVAAAEETKTLKRRIRTMEQAVVAPVTGSVDELVDWWNTSSAEAKRGLVQLMLHRIDVHPAERRGVRTIRPGRVVLWWRNEEPPAPIVLTA